MQIAAHQQIIHSLEADIQPSKDREVELAKQLEVAESEIDILREQVAKATHVLNAEASTKASATSATPTTSNALVGADPREVLELRDRVEHLSAELGEKHAELVEQESEITNLKHEIDQVVSGVMGLADARKQIQDLEHEKALQDKKFVIFENTDSTRFACLT